MSLSKMSLLDIPDLPMIKILENCNFMSLICLRKTCHSLRNFIDYLAPETEVANIEVNLWFDAIQIVLEDYPNNRYFPLKVLYRKCKEGCELQYFQERMTKNPNCPQYSEGREEVAKCIKDANFMDVFCMDLSVILKMQKTVLGCLRVYTKADKYYIYYEPKKIQKPSTGLLSFLGCCSRSRAEPETITEDLDPDIDLPSMCNRVYDTIEISLQSRPLRVKSVSLHATGKRQILQVLTNTDPNVLESLEVWGLPNKIDFELEIDELVNLEHWRRMKTVKLRKFKTIGSIENFGHFEKVHVKFDSMNTSRFQYLREKFLTTPNLSKFTLDYNNIEDPHNFNRIVGHPIWPSHYDTWEFPIPGTDQYLSVVNLRDFFVFERETLL